MPLYEHVYLARQDLSQQQVDELTAHYKGVIEQMGGNVAKVEYWGVKSLTYRIRKNRKAHFTLLNVEAPPAAISERLASGMPKWSRKWNNRMPESCFETFPNTSANALRA